MNPKTENRPAAGLPVWAAMALLLLLGTIWGGTFSLAKFGLAGGIPPLAYALWQNIGTALLLVILSRLLGKRIPASPRHLRFYFLVGFLGIALPNSVLFFVLREIPAGLMSVIITFAPLMTYGLAVAIGSGDFRKLRAFGLLLGLCGAATLALSAKGGGGELADYWENGGAWVLLAFLTPALYACNTIFTARHRPPDVSSVSLTAAMQSVSGILIFPVALLAGHFYLPTGGFGPADWALLAHMFLGALAFSVFFEIIRLVGPVFASQVAYVVTITGIAWGAFVFEERLTLWTYGATFVILAGLALVNWRPRAG